MIDDNPVRRFFALVDELKAYLARADRFEKALREIGCLDNHYCTLSSLFAMDDEDRQHFGPCKRCSALAGVPATEEKPTEGLPPDLARILRDPTITIPRDHEIRLDGRTLFEHLHEWRNAPSNTASAHIDPAAASASVGGRAPAGTWQPLADRGGDSGT